MNLKVREYKTWWIRENISEKKGKVKGDKKTRRVLGNNASVPN